ncbi:2-hydroxy-6-oxononadienedioate/2-hydroxy-6-oxononatrienedioate hydrolase [Anatilimnocola aggregata]|uniref:2-hydroxy-6-oxononadienedioate/2-hydroxy-6-oxononatrienedioate hydrolase n=1 Tax=Anatilimnocola aggregata TaxID=2528021 RepID=A0A517Y999_9BACT|nr:alpha/beta hydrolase [Anatilimnocola aggregata]QDU26796.1 2-hydroxy-6-oxononadienedioate/2-hydroxy-6-oxononatrienedioate hydrolase [Anatilimnocola aggregata]
MPFHEELAKSFTVLLPAHPGFADSKGLEDVRDVTDYAWHYVDLLAELKLSNVPIVGFSLGGWTSLELAILRPNLVSKLVLVNSAGIRLPDAKMGELFIDDLDQMRELVFLDPNNPAAKLAMPSNLEDPRILHWLRAREATARVGWNPYLHNPRLAAHLRRIACPTLVLWGRHDKLIPLPYGEYLAKAIAGARLEVFDDSAHMLPFEQPAKFAAIVKAFVL